jgi:hypothetical protein
LQIDKMGKQRQLDTEAITGNPNLKTSLWASAVMELWLISPEKWKQKFVFHQSETVNWSDQVQEIETLWFWSKAAWGATSWITESYFLQLWFSDLRSMQKRYRTNVVWLWSLSTSVRNSFSWRHTNI